MRDYQAETDRLTDRYNKAVGEALDRGIKVYHPGGQAMALGELEDAIMEHDNPGSSQRYNLFLAALVGGDSR